jgi:large subunit ribosomal protein L22
MELEVSYRYAKVAPRKARLVVDLVRGASVDDALNTLRLTRKRTSAMVTKLLKSAVATASERFDSEPEDLLVSKAWVDPGPMRKGWFARPRGMAARMRFRTCHIHLVVSSAPEEAPEEQKPAKAKHKHAHGEHDHADAEHKHAKGEHKHAGAEHKHAKGEHKHAEAEPKPAEAEAKRP